MNQIQVKSVNMNKTKLDGVMMNEVKRDRDFFGTYSKRKVNSNNTKGMYIVLCCVLLS